MVIRSSSSREVERLVAQLHSDTAANRDAAVARLRVIGGRAAGQLAALATETAAPAVARSAALRALEESVDDRARAAALKAVAADPDEVSVAAIAVLRGWLTGEHELTVLETLAAVALDNARSTAVRQAALDALSQLPADLTRPLRARVTAPVAAAAEEALPDSPLAAREWLEAHGDAPLSVLHRMVVHARERERQNGPGSHADEWQVTRGVAHAALARLGSRVALYDLRESFDAASRPLPLDFIVAVVEVGDSSCLEPMARAWAAAPGETWWRKHLASAAADIIDRTGVSRRSKLVRRLRQKYEGFF